MKHRNYLMKGMEKFTESSHESPRSAEHQAPESSGPSLRETPIGKGTKHAPDKREMAEILKEIEVQLGKLGRLVAEFINAYELASDDERLAAHVVFTGFV